MRSLLLLLVGLAALAELGYSDPLKNDTLPGKQFYQSLPSAERLDFLAFSLGDGYVRNETTSLQRVVNDFPFPEALGLDNKLIEKFRTLNAPENFANNLYGWIRSSFNLDQSNMRTLIVNRSVCLSNGNCIDISDIGGVCCPF